jgi:hypothetical protein
MVCKSQSGGKLYRIKKSVFLDKMRNSEVQMTKIKQKSAFIHKKMQKEVRKMKQSNVEIEDELKKVIDCNQFVAQPDIMQRNANIMRFFEDDMKRKGMVVEKSRCDRTKEEKAN